MGEDRREGCLGNRNERPRDRQTEGQKEKAKKEEMGGEIR